VKAVDYMNLKLSHVTVDSDLVATNLFLFLGLLTTKTEIVSLVTVGNQVGNQTDTQNKFIEA
jgi:hypothetical protein